MRRRKSAVMILGIVGAVAGLAAEIVRRERNSRGGRSDRDDSASGPGQGEDRGAITISEILHADRGTIVSFGERLTIKFEHTSAGITILKLAGEVDVYTAPFLREVWMELCNKRCLLFLFDLEDLEVLDSTGIGILVHFLKWLRLHDGKLVISLADKNILNIFGVAGLKNVFHILPTVPKAIDAFSSHPFYRNP